MGRLLWAELRYSFPGWLFAYLICLAFFALGLYRRNWDLFSFMITTSITYVITLGIMGSIADRELRTRANALLPLRPRAVGWLEVAYVTLFQLGMVAFWLAQLACRPGAGSAATLWGMASHNGLTLSLITLFMIHTHLRFVGTRAGGYGWVGRALAVGLPSTLVGLAYTGWIGPVARYLWGHYVSWTGALASTLLFAGLSALSVWSYERRRSYLD